MYYIYTLYTYSVEMFMWEWYCAIIAKNSCIGTLL